MTHIARAGATTLTLLLALTGCEEVADDTGGNIVVDTPDAGCSDIPQDERHLNYPSNDTGTFVENRTLCSGYTHEFKLNTPAPPQCDLSAQITYDGDGTDVEMQIYLLNGEVLQATSEQVGSPEDAATTTDGGSMAVRVRLTAGDRIDYELTIDYICP